MHSWGGVWRWICILGAWSFFYLLICTSTFAAEEPEKFLAQLRARGYFDTASDYLGYIASSNLVDESFKESIPFEQAVTLKERAARSGDRVKQEQLLADAVKAFQEFATANPNSIRGADVRMEVANVYSILARLTLAQANREGADRKQLEGKASKYYADALSEVVQAEAMIQGQRKKVRGDLAAVRKAAGNAEDPNRKVSKKERDLITLRGKLRDDWIKSEYTQVTLTDRQATVFEKGSEQWKAALEKAAKAYEEMFFKHDVRLVGLICRVQQMRCLTELGRFDEALDCLPDVTDYEESDNAPLRKVWFDSFVLELEALIGKGDLQRAVQIATKTRLTKVEQRTPQAKKILFLRAKAELALLEKLGPDKKKEKARLLADAKNVLGQLVKSQSAYDSQATEMLASIGVKVNQVEEEAGDPEDFDTAFKQALGVMQRWGKLSKQVASANGDEKKKLELELKELDTKAFNLYRLAISLTENDTSAEKLRGVQKGLCYLYFNRGDYLRAAVLGEYLVKMYPGTRDAKFGGNVAINAWLKLYGQAGANKDYEQGKIEHLATESIRRDPDSSQAQAARGYLLTFAISDGEVDAAWDYLRGLPASTPKLNKSQILVGQLLWNRYSRDRRLSEDARPTVEALDADRNRAAELLAAGLAGYKDPKALDYAAVQGAYILAMLLLSENQPRESIATLENPVYGPLTLIKAKNPVVMRPDYAAKVYRLALRAYIGGLPLYADDPDKQDELVNNAFDIVSQLEKSVGNDSDAESRLTKIYVDLGKDLEMQIQGLSESGNETAKRALVDAFEMFLGQIKKSPAPTVTEELAKMGVAKEDATDAQKQTAKDNVAKKSYRRLIWIAETYFTLGNSNRESDAKLAKLYYEEAASTYNRILKRKLHSNPRQRTTIQLRLADCYRGMRDYKEALDQLVEVLGNKGGNLTAQLQAAETLYEAGEEDCGDYVKSILGDEEDEDTGNNIIWGWKKLAQQTNGNESFADYFFQAKLYGVRARRMYAACMTSDDEAKKKKLLAAAKGNLLQIYSQFPSLGGDRFKAEFEAEMKQVQGVLGEEQIGFPVRETESDDEPVAVTE